MRRWLLRCAVSITAALSAVVVVRAACATFGWGDCPFAEGWFAGLAYCETYDAQWLKRNLDEWWGPS